MGDVNLVPFLLAKRILLFIGAGRFCLVGQERVIAVIRDFKYLESIKIALGTGVEFERGKRNYQRHTSPTFLSQF